MVPVHAMVAAEEAKSIPKRFREAGATEPGTAMRWAPAGKAEEISLKRLIERGALVEMRPGMWYLNEEKLAAGGGGQVALVVMFALGALMLGMSLFFLAR